MPDDSPRFPIRRVGRFEILEELGRGRYGTVFRARDPETGEERAVKRISGAVADDPVMRRRCLREAELAARFDHPGIVRVHGLEEFDHGLLLIQDVCPGKDLQTALELRGDPAVPLDWAVEVVRQLAEAVAHGHDRGVVHRDLKPGNVMVDPPPRALGESEDLLDDADAPADAVTAYVLDYGLALPLDADFRLTRSTMMVGTPLYMAPEQASGNLEAVGPPTDVFGLGAILYELLVGRPPFEAPDVTSILERLAEGRPLPPRSLNPDIPFALETIVLQTQRTEPDDRYPDAAALADDLRRFQQGDSIAATRESPWERTRDWLRRPKRSRQLGVAMLFIGGPMMAWALFNTIATPFLIDDRTVPFEEFLISIVVSLATFQSSLAYTLYVGYRLTRDRATRTGLTITLVLMLYFGLYAAGMVFDILPSPVAIYQERALAKMFIHAVMAVHCGLLAMLAALALTTTRR